MTCKEAIDVLGDYLEQTLATELAEELSGTWAIARPVGRISTRTGRRELTGRAGRAPMPDEMKSGSTASSSTA